MKTKNVIEDIRTGKIYWDDGIIRNFEKVLLTDVTIEQAKKKYPKIIEV